MIKWFLFDLGNTVITLGYQRVLTNIAHDTKLSPEQVAEILERPGGYRDLERGSKNFYEFYEFACDAAGYGGSIRDFHELWSDFFDGTVPGIEDVLTRIRQRYRVAFLSNSNEVHAEVIPKKFPALFRKDDPLIFSHKYRCAKPDPQLFHHALQLIRVAPEETALVDDLAENVEAARALGMQAFRFVDSKTLVQELEGEGLL